jgi:hypothetical protein
MPDPRLRAFEPAKGSRFNAREESSGQSLHWAGTTQFSVFSLLLLGASGPLQFAGGFSLHPLRLSA